MRFQTILPFYYIDVGPKIQYFLLCDSLPEERALREELQRKRLVSALLMNTVFKNFALIFRKVLMVV